MLMYMGNGNETAMWLQRISQQLHMQSAYLMEMERAVKRLEEEIAEWKHKNQTHIDKVEYNFDQLKVEKLEGTLNIGLTPMDVEAGTGGEGVDDLSVSTQTAEEVSSDSNQSPTYSQYFDQMQRYLEQEVPKEIEELETRFKFIAGTAYRKAVMDDIRQQLEPRIRYYLAHPPTDKSLLEEQEIMSQLKKDVNTAIRQHFEQLARKREDD